MIDFRSFYYKNAIAIYTESLLICFLDSLCKNSQNLQIEEKGVYSYVLILKISCSEYPYNTIYKNNIYI